VAGPDLLASLHISLGTLTAFVLLLQRFFVPIMTLGNEWQTVQAALAGLERIFQVLALPSTESAPRSPHQPRSRSKAALEMRQVVFGYLPNHPILHGVSLAAQPGENLVLVGRTGAGKSSVLHLLGGLYTPWSGTVRVAGADPTVLTDDQRRRAMGVVQQVVHLFHGTVFDNLTLGDTSVSREAVQRAAAIAGADTFIQALPQGYDTLLGGGTNSRLDSASCWPSPGPWCGTRPCCCWTRPRPRSIAPARPPFEPPSVRRSWAAAARYSRWPIAWPPPKTPIGSW
jgi:ATP-binding cassette, subfamily B, multidrug efflux pump